MFAFPADMLDLSVAVGKFIAPSYINSKGADTGIADMWV